MKATICSTHRGTDVISWIQTQYYRSEREKMKYLILRPSSDFHFKTPKIQTVDRMLSTSYIPMHPYMRILAMCTYIYGQIINFNFVICVNSV